MIKVFGTTIILPKGDEGIINFPVRVIGPDGAGSPIDPERDRCVFSMFQFGQEIKSTRKILPIVDGAATLHFTNADTDTLAAGEYNWDLRLVIDPIWNAQETDITGGEVHSPFVIDGVLPILKLREVGTNV